MRENTKRDLRKLFKLLKARRPLWDKNDDHFYCAKTVNDLWIEVFQEMNLKDSEVKSLLLQLRELLRVKKPKRVSQLKAYFNKGNSDWRNVSYLKGVENLRSISSLDIDEDSDSTCTVSTMTTDIEADNSSCSDLAVGNLPAVGDSVAKGSAVLEMAFGDIVFDDVAFGNMAIGDSAEIDLDKVDLAKVDPAKADPAKVDPAKVDPAKFDPTKFDPMDLAEVDPVDSEWTCGESVDNGWFGDESPEMSWIDSGSDSNIRDKPDYNVDSNYNRRYYNGQKRLLSTETPFKVPLDTDRDFLSYFVYPRLAQLHSSARMPARIAILKAIEMFE